MSILLTPVQVDRFQLGEPFITRLSLWVSRTGILDPTIEISGINLRSTKYKGHTKIRPFR